jgi:hypothetical protein
MKLSRETLLQKLKSVLQFIFNPRFLLCYGLAWMITNGWSYLFFVIGTYLKIDWMIGLAGAYLAFLWLPISPEKLATVSIAMLLLKLIFPRDDKTLGVLRSLYTSAKAAMQAKRHSKKRKKKDGSVS